MPWDTIALFLLIHYGVRSCQEPLKKHGITLQPIDTAVLVAWFWFLTH